MPQISADSPTAGEVPPWLNGSRGYVADGLLVVNRAAAPIAATLVPGSLPRGAVLGKITVSGIYALCDATQTDGRQVPAAVLAGVADARTNRSATVYLSGSPTPNVYDTNYLLWHSSWSLPALGAAMATAGLPVITRGFGASF